MLETAQYIIVFSFLNFVVTKTYIRKKCIEIDQFPVLGRIKIRAVPVT